MAYNTVGAEYEKPYRLGALAYMYDPDSHQLLLVQLNGYMDDEWNVPGGGRHANETAEDNIIREIGEELGISSDQFDIVARAAKPLEYDFPSSFLASGDLIATTYRGQRKDQFLVHFNARKHQITINRQELKDYKWSPLNQLSTYLKFPGQLESALEVLEEFGLK